ncbi:MAG: HEAT repeat domain-containing protein [Ignavibacteriales bacterium]|nr:MAG: HEAT repeat domain-containing protein [Ignavibacteriales bacterium]
MDSAQLNKEEILRLLNSADPVSKAEIINQLEDETADETVVEKLCSLLSDEDKWVRFSASVKLKALSNSKIPFMLVKFIPSPDIALRNLAGDILLNCRSNPVTALTEFLPTGNDDDKKFAADLLGLIGDKNAAPSIIQLLKSSDNDNVILACLEAFGNMQCDAAVDDIITIYDKNEVFKPTAVEALGKIGSDDALRFIISRYEDEDSLTQFSMIEALGLIGSEETYFFCLNQLNNTSGPLTWPLLHSIQQLKMKFGFDIPYDEKIKNSILYTLKEGEVKYKLAAAHIVSVFGDPDLLVETLNVLGIDAELDDEIKSKVFENAGMLLPKLSALIKTSPAGLKNLLLIVEELLLINRERFVSLISPIEFRNLVDGFASCLENPDEEIRRLAMELLFGVDESTAMLFTDIMLGDSNIWNKLKLVELLDSVQSEQSNEALKKLADDSEVMIADRASFTLSSRNIATTTLGINN